VTLDSAGLALALLLLLALAHLGATLAPGRWGWREQSRSRMIASAVFVALAVVMTWPGVRRRVGLDLEPPLPPVATVHGEWRDGSDTVNFGSGRYECRGTRCTGMSYAGEWERVGRYGVRVRWSDGHEVVWRIVGYKGRLRLALLPLEGDVGPIDGRLYYAKVE
jgi:hypothetical protein